MFARVGKWIEPLAFVVLFVVPGFWLSARPDETDHKAPAQAKASKVGLAD